MYYVVEYKDRPVLETGRVFLIKSSNYEKAKETAEKQIGRSAFTIRLATIHDVGRAVSFSKNVSEMRKR